MGLTSFCGLLTLQVGATIMGATFLTVAGVTLAANLFGYYNNSDGWAINLLLMVVFVILMVLAGALMFGSTYTESRKLALLALLMIIITFCYWLILSCFSLVSSPDTVSTVCIFTRCPETFWIASLRYRTIHSKETNADYDETTETTESTTITTPATSTNESLRIKRKRAVTAPLPLENKIISFNLPHSFDKNSNFSAESTSEYSKQDIPNGYKTPSKVQELELKYYTPQNPVLRSNKIITENPSRKMWEGSRLYFHFLNSSAEKADKDEKDKPRVEFGFPLIGAIFLFIVNILFFLFSAFIMWSWAQELDWSDYYIEDDPVLVYEEDY